MKNTLDGIKRLDVTKEKIIELKYIVMQNIQNEIKNIGKIIAEIYIKSLCIFVYNSFFLCDF